MPLRAPTTQPPVALLAHVDLADDACTLQPSLRACLRTRPGSSTGSSFLVSCNKMKSAALRRRTEALAEAQQFVLAESMAQRPHSFHHRSDKEDCGKAESTACPSGPLARPSATDTFGALRLHLFLQPFAFRMRRDLRLVRCSIGEAGTTQARLSQGINASRQITTGLVESRRVDNRGPSRNCESK